MQVARTFSYRHAEAIIEKAFPVHCAEIKEVLLKTPWVPLDQPVVRRRKGKVVATKSIDQTATNKALDKAFVSHGWAVHPRIVSEADSKLVADYKKGAVQVEVQFGNMARWYTDVFKFLLSYAANDIEVGVLIVAMQKTANKIDENVVYFERVIRELPHAKMAVTIPVWVIGVS
jgi:hypothetical protein